MSGLIGYLNNPVKILTGVDAPGAKEWTFDNSGNFILPQGGNILDYNGNTLIGVEFPVSVEGYLYNDGLGNLSWNTSTNGNIVFTDNTISNGTLGNPIILSAGTNDWTLNATGEFILPTNGFVRQNRVISKANTADITTGLPTVVWSSQEDNVSSAKLLIQVEQDPGDSTPDHCQSCEAIIAAKGSDGTDVPVITVYGITYTGLGPLATFSVQRNATTRVVEVVATLLNTTDPAYLNIYSVEQLTRGS